MVAGLTLSGWWRLDGAGSGAHEASFEAREDLGLEVVCGTGIVGQEDGAGAALGADVAEGCRSTGVSRTSAMTSSAVEPGTDSRKFSMEARRPSMMAWRSAAMPLPCRAFDSASASACFTLRILSASRGPALRPVLAARR